MDAANCISTLEQRAPEGVRPQVADYALMDLACDDSFMTRLYHAMAKEAIDWWSLFEGTPLQPSWKAGPILLDLRAAPRFQTELLAWAEATPGRRVPGLRTAALGGPEGGFALADADCRRQWHSAALLRSTHSGTLALRAVL